MTLIRFLKQYFSSFRGRTAFFYTDPEQAEPAKVTTCLLYTSDAADD